MIKLDEVKLIAEMLFNKYGCISLDTKQTAEVLDISEIKLKMDRSKASGLDYTKLGRSVKYSIIDIANYIIENKKKVL